MPRVRFQTTAGELAARFALALRGDPAQVVDGVGTLAGAGPTQLSFLANPKYRGQLAQSSAGLVVMRAADADGHGGNALLADDPYVAYARIAALFDDVALSDPGIHPSAVVDPGAEIDSGASIGPFAFVGAGSRIAAGARLGPGCVVGEDCEIGAGSVLVARVTLVKRVRLGRRVLVHPGAVIGADGFGIALARTPGEEAHWIKVPQLGGVRIGDDCEIGANTTIDRGALDYTVIGDS